MKNNLPPKPKRVYTRRITTLVVVWAMGISTYTMIYEPSLFESALAELCLLILGVVGAYQGTGHADLRATLQAQPDHVPPEGFGE